METGSFDDLPAALRFARRWRAASLRDVAEATGISPSQIQRIETGTTVSTHIATFEALMRWIVGK